MNEAEFTVVRIARIAASIDLDPGSRADILGANELDDETWERVEESHDDALRREVGAGDTSRLDQYDAAYVARVEEERGEISVADYASIVRASQSGTSAVRLVELEIPEAAEMMLVRVFERRLAADDALRLQLRVEGE